MTRFLANFQEAGNLPNFKTLTLDRLFGYEHGRLIAVFPDPKKGENWWKLLYRHLAELVPGKANQIEKRIRNLKDSACISSRRRSVVEDGSRWLASARSTHDEKPFQAVLGEDPAQIPSPFFPFQDFHNPPEEFPEFLRDSIHVTDTLKDPNVFLSHLEPLVSTAKIIHFIDPYFNPTGENWARKNTVRDLSKLLAAANRLRVTVNFHSSLPDGVTNAGEFSCEVQREVEAWFPIQTDLSFSVWSQKYQGPRLHARYLLTDKGGAGLDYGLDIKKGLRTDVSLLPMPMVEKRVGEYDPENGSLFELENSQIFKGIRQ
jgi:hypothetical protein